MKTKLKTVVPMLTVSRSALSVLAAGIVFVFSGCATGRMNVSSAPPPDVITINVQPFTSANYNRLSAGDKGLRDFEHLYLPVQLVEHLNATPGCSNAYFSTGRSAATDFTVEGEVRDSNGRDLWINLTLTRIDGTRVLNGDYRLSHQQSDEASVRAALSEFMRTISAELVKAGLNTTINLHEARAFAYADNYRLEITSKRLLDATVAAEIERKEILGELTAAMMSRARIAEGPYVEWQSLSTPLIEEREAARRQRSGAAFAGVMGAVGQYAALYAGARMEQSGAAGGTALAQGGLVGGAQVMAQADVDYRVAQNKVEELTETLAAFTNTFAVGATRELTVRIYDRVITLTGSQAEHLNEFHAVVRERLLAEPDEPESATDQTVAALHRDTSLRLVEN